MTSRPRVLIVDDEERFRNTMCKLLTLHGITAATAGSGPEALKELEENPYDLVILDVRMPEMGGVQLLSEIRKADSDIEAIIMTGYASVDTAKELMKLGAYDYMLKPYKVEDLLEKIEAAFDRKLARARLTGRDARSEGK
ncbi:MAG: response regulator [Desulfomonile sp.]|nr:response regulator [Desulfomonile sp.]